MFSFNPLKVFAITFAISVAAVGLCLPDAARSQQQPAPPAASTSQGGGVYLLMQLDTDDLSKKWMDLVAGDLRQILRQERIAFSNLVASKDEVRVTLRDEPQIGPAIDKFKSQLVVTLPAKLFGLFGGGPDMDVLRESATVVFKPTQAGKAARTDNALDTTVEILKLRVNPDGTKQIAVKRESADRISLKAPGVNDSAELKNQISRTSLFGLHLIDESMPPSEAKKNGPPPGSVLYKARKDAMGDGGEYLVFKQAQITNADLATANADFGLGNQPVVSFRLTPSGAHRFGQVTRENVGKPFAIVLDSEVISAPIIREPILGGSGQISGNFTLQEANTIALLIRSGSFPAKLTIVEERSLDGGSLGVQPR